MSSQPGSPKKKASETISFIKNTNPEVFEIQPRTGGLLPIKPSSNFATSTKIGEDLIPGSQRQFQDQVNETISKEFRVQTALDETGSLDSEDVTFANPLKDAMYMFGIAISTLIMMASNQTKIPDDHLKWTTHSLDCVRDDFGNHPPNVQGVLNHIKHLKSKSGDAPPPGEQPVEESTVPETTGGMDDGTTDRAVEDKGEDEEEYEGEQTVKTTAKIRMGSKDED